MRCDDWRSVQQTACMVAGASCETRKLRPEESAEEELVQCGAACPGVQHVVPGQKLPSGVCDQLNLILRRGR
jgi:hypothetical protein